MKYAIEVVNHVIVAIHSFDDDTPIPSSLVYVESIEGIELGQAV